MKPVDDFVPLSQISVAKVLCFRAVRLSGQVLLALYLMNGLNNLNETYRVYALAPTDDLIRFCRSVVKVTVGS